jgi:hypothetical protein
MPDEKLIWVLNTEKTESPGLYKDYTGTLITFVNGYEGKPRATDEISVEQLERKNMVGIYRLNGGPELGIVDCYPAGPKWLPPQGTMLSSKPRP